MASSSQECDREPHCEQALGEDHRHRRTFGVPVGDQPGSQEDCCAEAEEISDDELAPRPQGPQHVAEEDHEEGGGDGEPLIRSTGTAGSNSGPPRNATIGSAPATRTKAVPTPRRTGTSKSCRNANASRRRSVSAARARIGQRCTGDQRCHRDEDVGDLKRERVVAGLLHRRQQRHHEDCDPIEERAESGRSRCRQLTEQEAPLLSSDGGASRRIP